MLNSSIMQKGPYLEFKCTRCRQPVHFSAIGLSTSDISCSHCHLDYGFGPEIIRQLSLFEALCRQIAASKEILGMTNVGISFGDTEVKIPYKLLLTRLNSTLDITIDNTPVSIAFRLEPAVEFTY